LFYKKAVWPWITTENTLYNLPLYL
jgi:hypothetical protein